MKTPKLPKRATPKQRIADSLRKSGKDMVMGEEGPYDRIYGKDMNPEESVEKRGRTKLRKGGMVKK